MYQVVTFPLSQKLYEQDWFDECFLINDEKGLEVYGNCAYFVPVERYNELYPNEIKD